MGKVDQLQDQIARQEQKVAQARDRFREAAAEALGALDALSPLIEARLDETRADVDAIVEDWPLVTAAPWDADWSSWDPEQRQSARSLRAGDFVEGRTGATLVPWRVPFIGGKGIVVVSTDDSEDTGDALLRSLMLRAVLALPHHAKLTLLDPSGLMRNFRNVNRLPGVQNVDSDVRKTLDEVIAHIRHVNQTYLDGRITTFHDLPDAQRRAEDYRLVVCADYPRGYDLRALDALRTIAETGPDAGVYLLMHAIDDGSGQQLDLPFDKGVARINVANSQATLHGLGGHIRFDGDPPDDLEDALLDRLGEATPETPVIDWAALHENVEAFADDATHRIEVPVGRSGVTQPLKLTFGVDHDSSPTVHAILAGVAGSGKSTFYRSLISGIAHRYSPDEVELYLVDGKFGAEFRVFADLPHARVVSLKTNPVVARSVLQELVDEMARRNEVFAAALSHDGSRADGAGDTADYTTYRAAGYQMPRILLIVDEYQYLFEEDTEDTASELLRQLTTIGRSAGIHVFLASQRFTPKGLRYRDDIFQNIHTRIAMQMSADEVRALTEFTPDGRRLIETTCDRTGKLVVNNRGGADAGNMPGQAALITDEQRRGTVNRARDRFPGRTPIVLHGDRQASVPSLLPFAARLEGSTPAELEATAHRPWHEEGFGRPDWIGSEHPLLVPLGRELSVAGQVAAMLRRAGDENVLVVIDEGTIRVPVLAATIAAASLLDAHGAPCELSIADLSLTGIAWHGLLPRIAEVAASRGTTTQVVTSSRDVGDLVGAVHHELQRRSDLSDEALHEASSHLVVLHQPERAEALEQDRDDFGPVPSAAGEQLIDLLEKGPRRGIHVVVAAPAMGDLSAVLPDRALVAFRHRIGTQMSEDDSFELLQASAAARLAAWEPPRLGVYSDVRRGRLTRFVPPMLGPDHDAFNSLVADLESVLPVSTAGVAQ